MAPLARREGDELVVGLGALFRLRVPLDDVESVDDIGKTRFAAGIGVHGWGDWFTVNLRRSPAPLAAW